MNCLRCDGTGLVGEFNGQRFVDKACPVCNGSGDADNPLPRREKTLAGLCRHDGMPCESTVKDQCCMANGVWCARYPMALLRARGRPARQEKR